VPESSHIAVHPADPTRRFSTRVRDYSRWRPGYPEALLETLLSEAGLSPDSTIADIGAGTGISSELLLRPGCAVFAVEPNEAMRAEAERRLGANARFHAVAGTAEATTLPAARVDLVAAGQAFHWFDPTAARAEFSRILRPNGSIALFWNTRSIDATPFLRSYEALLREFGTDYDEVARRYVSPERFPDFFRGGYRYFTFAHEQVLDYQGLEGRLLSSSYTPEARHPRRAPTLQALKRIFDTYQEDGTVRLLHLTELYLGT
jgi:SAM-dependent methyltransferase